MKRRSAFLSGCSAPCGGVSGVGGVGAASGVCGGAGAAPDAGAKWPRRLHNKRSHKSFAENYLSSSSLMYIKLLLLWATVLVCDYFVEFRFEYLWPFWLFLRSVYDSFKYQGLAFSVFFICIAITSDMICFLFIPVHWLFFAASTYVWVQYVWHTEKGVCLPTICLWLLFVYIEASIRLREFKAHIDLKDLPLHLDLCRPFASHCIGYPVVTLGFGFKSYVGYRMRQRKQREVQKENEFYYDFLREALPKGTAVREEAFNHYPSQKSCFDERISEACSSSSSVVATPTSPSSCSYSSTLPSNSSPVSASSLQSNHHNSANGYTNGGITNHTSTDVITTQRPGENGDLSSTPRSKTSKLQSNGIDSEYSESVEKSGAISAKDKDKKSKLSKDDLLSKLESDLKRLKTDLQQSRNKENDLRDQIISYMSGERHLKSEISNLQVEKSVLESRVSGLTSTRAAEKAQLSSLERRLAEERRQKTDFQIKLETERKTKKEAQNAERNAQLNQNRSELLKLEAEMQTLRQELQCARERSASAEHEVLTLRKYKETHGDPEVLVKALKTMQEKNNQIEKSLSAETKLKMDLFSALGEAKRELVIKQGLLLRRDKEILDLKAKIAEVLAVMPHSNLATAGGHSSPSPSPGAAAYAPVTLSLDLPAATDLSFTGKISSLGLADYEDSGEGMFHSSLFPKTNGSKVNDV